MKPFNNDYRKRCPGPRSREGKEKSSQNSRTHGLLSKRLVFAGPEEQAEYEELLSNMRASFPAGSPAEDVEIKRLAHAYWNLRKVEREMDAARAIDVRDTLQEFFKKSDVLRLSIPGLARNSGQSNGGSTSSWHCDDFVLRIGSDQQECGEVASQKQPYGVVRDGDAEHYSIEMRLSSTMKLLDRYYTMYSKEIDRILNRLRTIRELQYSAEK